MRTFEERYTAWIDGNLTGDELAQFEKELAAHPEAEAERSGAQRLSHLLRSHGEAPPLVNGDFFNYSLMARIEAESAAATRAKQQRSTPWTLPRLAWAGAFCLLVAGVLFQALIPEKTPALDVAGEPYFAEIVDVWPADPSITAEPVYTPRDNVTVLWLEGLDYLPASYTLQ